MGTLFLFRHFRQGDSLPHPLKKMLRTSQHSCNMLNKQERANNVHTYSTVVISVNGEARGSEHALDAFGPSESKCGVDTACQTEGPSTADQGVACGPGVDAAKDASTQTEAQVTRDDMGVQTDTDTLKATESPEEHEGTQGQG